MVSKINFSYNFLISLVTLNFKVIYKYIGWKLINSIKHVKELLQIIYNLFYCYLDLF